MKKQSAAASLTTTTTTMMELRTLRFATAAAFWLIALLALPHPGRADDTAPRKILCLHGAFGTPSGFKNTPGMEDLEEALPEYEFVYARGGYPFFFFGRLWVPFDTNSNPNAADNSLQALDEIWDEQGPFEAILGFSQGAAFTSVYLAHRQQTYGEHGFQKAVTVSGYLLTGQSGLITEKMDLEKPFDGIPSYHWIGWFDNVITPFQSFDVLPYYTDPVVGMDRFGNHDVPQVGSERFDEVVSFLKDELDCPADVIFAPGVSRDDCAVVQGNPSLCSGSIEGNPVALFCPETCDVTCR